MKIVTSAKFDEPTFENGLVKLQPKNGEYPEYIETCKFVDQDNNLVYFLNGPTKERVLSNSSKRKVELRR